MATFADKPTLTGKRIRLRPITVEDAEAMFGDLGDDEATRLTGTHQQFRFDQVRAWCGSRQDEDDRLDLAVVELGRQDQPDRWAGEIVLSEWDPDNQSCSFRIALSTVARGRGLGREAVELLLTYVFAEIADPPVNRIELEVFDFNERAKALYRNIGFQTEGRKRQALRWDGQFHDAIVMSLLRADRARESSIERWV